LKFTDHSSEEQGFNFPNFSEFYEEESNNPFEIINERDISEEFSNDFNLKVFLNF